MRDKNKRLFLKVIGGVGAALLASSVFPKRAEALVLGSTPGTSVVGLKSSSNARIDPATDGSVQALLPGLGVTKATVSLSSPGGIVHTTTSLKSMRVYSIRFSVATNTTSVTFRFGDAGSGTDIETYLLPMAGGLYGSRNHPNFVQGSASTNLYCIVSGGSTVQVNVDYTEV